MVFDHIIEILPQKGGGIEWVVGLWDRLGCRAVQTGLWGCGIDWVAGLWDRLGCAAVG